MLGRLLQDSILKNLSSCHGVGVILPISLGKSTGEVLQGVDVEVYVLLLLILGLSKLFRCQEGVLVNEDTWLDLGLLVDLLDQGEAALGARDVNWTSGRTCGVRIHVVIISTLGKSLRGTVQKLLLLSNTVLLRGILNERLILL